MSVTAELAFISKVIQERDVISAVEAHITAEHFSVEKYREMWEWILDYWHKYGESPTFSVYKREYPDISLVDQKHVPMDALVDELKWDLNTALLTEGVLRTSKDLQDGVDPREITGALASLVNRVSYEASAMRDIDITQTWRDRLDRYEALRKHPNALGPGAIPTGFSRLDNITNGLRPQQLITLVGEPKTGKSTLALLIAMACHRFNVPPLFVSFEMSLEEQTARHDAFLVHTDHSKLTRGDSPPPHWDLLQKTLKRRREMGPFYMTEDAHALTTISALRAKVHQYQPGFLVVDGVYLMQDEQGAQDGTPLALTHITRGMKRMAQQLEIPILITTQVLSWKMDSRKSNRVTAGAIGYSSSFVQDSDLVMAVEADADTPNQSIVRVVLGRNTARDQAFGIRWDWKTSDFEEVDHVIESDKDDEERTL